MHLIRFVLVGVFGMVTVGAAHAQGQTVAVQDARPVIDKASRATPDLAAAQVNPFTGHAAAMEEAARELALIRQRRNIAEQRLAEQRAVSEMEKLKRDAAGQGTVALPASSTGSVPLGPTAALGAAAATGHTEGVAAQDPMLQRHTSRPARVARVGRQEPSAAQPKQDVPSTPDLVGVTQVGGKRYALFEQNGHGWMVEEGRQDAGLSVGKIEGRAVMVNGIRQVVPVGIQEVALPTRAGGATGATKGTPSARVGTMSVERDMVALQLPAVPDNATPIGPQPLRPAVAAAGSAPGTAR